MVFRCLRFPPKHERRNSTLLLWYLKSICFRSFLRGNRRHHKTISFKETGSQKKLSNFAKLQFSSDKIYSCTPKKSIWHLAIQQNWCFGQFSHWRIEVWKRQIDKCTLSFWMLICTERSVLNKLIWIHILVVWSIGDSGFF